MGVYVCKDGQVIKNFCNHFLGTALGLALAFIRQGAMY